MLTNTTCAGSKEDNSRLRFKMLKMVFKECFNSKVLVKQHVQVHQLNYSVCKGCVMSSVDLKQL